MIYLDNAATTLKKPDSVIEAVVKAMQSMGNASRGAHASSLEATDVVYQTRVKLAKFVNCKRADHVVFTMNATESLNIAIRGAIEPGSHVVTTELEHNSVLRPLYLMERECGVHLSFVPTKNGKIDPEQFEELITPDTKTIVCTHASNLTGNVVDIKRVGEIAKKHGLLFIVDASQTMGSLPIDMEEMNIDILCFTGHKGLMGPQGTGGMCIREGVEIKPFKVGGSGVHSYEIEQPHEYPTRLEAGTLNSHGIAGLSAALDYLADIGMDAVEEKERHLVQQFYDGVKDIPGVTIYSDVEAVQHAAIVSLNIWDFDSAIVSDVLAEEYGIATRSGAHCAPRMHEALNTTEQGAVRFSFGWFTTDEDIEKAINAVEDIASNN